MLNEFGTDIWVFTNEQWLTRNPDGEYVRHEIKAIKHDPTIIPDFAPYLAQGLQDRRRQFESSELLARCEAAMQAAVGATATAVRSQTYYLDITPPGFDKGTFVTGMAKRLGIPLSEAIATIGDMQQRSADVRQDAAFPLRWAMPVTTERNAGDARHRRRTKRKGLRRQGDEKIVLKL